MNCITYNYTAMQLYHYTTIKLHNYRVVQKKHYPRKSLIILKIKNTKTEFFSKCIPIIIVGEFGKFYFPIAFG